MLRTNIAEVLRHTRSHSKEDKLRAQTAFALALALICATWSFTFDALAAGTVLLGDQSVKTSVDSNLAGHAEAFRTTAGASGALVSISVYIDASSAAKSLTAGIYSDNGGSPGALLTQGQLANPIAGWNTVTVPSVNVVSGSVYWIAILSPTGLGKLAFRDTGSGGVRSEESKQTNLASLPTTWSTGPVWQSSPASVYASAAASLTPVLSVSPPSVTFTAIAGGNDPLPASLNVNNIGAGTLSFTTTANQSWLSISQGSGNAPPSQSVAVAAKISGLAAGSYNGSVTVAAGGASGSPAVVPVTLTVTSPAPPPPTGSDWPTNAHDASRSGNAAGESVITPGNINKLALSWATLLDGKVTAQPLFLSGGNVLGASHDVIVAVTAANSIYALDANAGTVLWRLNFGPPDGTGAVPGGFGIEASPVIDRATGRVFTVTQDAKLRTVSLANGSEISPALQLIGDSAVTNKVWGGLNLVGNNLYIATASDGNDIVPWQGRIIRVDISGANPVLAGAFKVVPSVAAPHGGGGIWGYGGVSADPATGRIYAATGATDSMPEGYAPFAGSMIALDANLNLLGSYQPPPLPCQTAQCDWDFGATPIVFTPTGCATLVAAVSKDGHLYLEKAADLAASAPPVQSVALNNAFDGPGTGGLIGVPAYWPAGNMLFITDAGPGINGVRAGVVQLIVTPACTLQVGWSVSLPIVGADQPPSAPTVADGVVFVGTANGGGVHAYDANTGAELWNSGAVITGGATYAAPIVAAGNLYVASWNGLSGADAGTVRRFSIGANPPPPPPPATVLLGTQTIQTTLDDNAPGLAEAFQATAVASGTVGVLSIYLDASSAAPTLVAGLYSDSNGHPGSLIALGSRSNLTPGAWNDIPIPGAVVSSGTPYWIAILGVGGTARFRDASGCRAENSQQTNLTSLPATWVSGSAWASCPLSGYGRTNP